MTLILQKPHQGVFMNALAFSYNRLKKRQRDDSYPHHFGKMKPSSLYADRVLTHLVSNDNSTSESRLNKKIVRLYEQDSLQKRIGKTIRWWLGGILIVTSLPLWAGNCVSWGVDDNTSYMFTTCSCSGNSGGWLSVIAYQRLIGDFVRKRDVGVCASAADSICNESVPTSLSPNTTYYFKNLSAGATDYFKCTTNEGNNFSLWSSHIPNSNTAPSADAGKSYSIMEGTDLVLDASGSSDADGDSLSYAWDLDNDGTYDDATGVNPTVTWETLSGLEYVIGVGSFSIGLEVNDGKGETDIAIASLTITSSVINSDDDKSGMIEHSESSSMTELAHFTKGLESFLKGMEHYDNKDYVEAVKWIREAAELGLAQAQDHLGVMYDNGKGVTENDQEAVKWYRKAAKQGLAKAQNNLGVMYLQGQGITQNGLEAAKWFHKAAEQKNVNAQTNLGVMYMNGQGITQDNQEAVKWYRKAAEQGFAQAQFNLGVMYEFGKGVTEDKQEAVKWFRKAAEQGFAKAQYHLGVMYANGEGVTEDDQRAVQWFRQAAEQGHAQAQYDLGGMYRRSEGVTQDFQEAVTWYRKAAEQGHADAQGILGMLYEYGKGVTQNDQKAVEWYRKAAEQGHAIAQHSLGIMYEQGKGVTQNDKEAIKWNRKSAEQGFSPAQFRLGWLYIKGGNGIKVDYQEALKWFRKAAEQGNAEAQQIVKQLEAR
jgi:TPR repeat protein